MYANMIYLPLFHLLLLLRFYLSPPSFFLSSSSPSSFFSSLSSLSSFFVIIVIFIVSAIIIVIVIIRVQSISEQENIKICKKFCLFVCWIVWRWKREKNRSEKVHVWKVKGTRKRNLSTRKLGKDICLANKIKDWKRVQLFLLSLKFLKKRGKGFNLDRIFFPGTKFNEFKLPWWTTCCQFIFEPPIQS